MIAFFALLFFVLKVPEKLESFRVSLKKKVDESDSVVVSAKEEYAKVADSVKGIEDEIAGIITKAEKTAKFFEENAKEDLKKSLENIKINVEKHMITEENHVKTTLLQGISSSSIEAAGRQIKNALEKDKSLHKKYIDEFIDSIESIEL